MNSSPDTTSNDTIDVILVGGPDDLPTTARSQRVPRDGQKVKIHHRGGYEHFERVEGARQVSTPVVYRWTARTRIAE